MAEIPAPDMEPERRRKKSAGEHVFDRTVYTGIGFVANEILSLGIANQFRYGRNLLSNASEPLKRAGRWFSKEGFEDISRQLAKTFKVVDKLGADGKMIEASKRAGNSLLMLALLSGGTLLIWPM